MRARGEHALVPLHFHVASQDGNDIMIIATILFPFVRIKQINFTCKKYIIMLNSAFNLSAISKYNI